MDNEFEDSLLRATDLELNQRDRYVKAFEHEYRLIHPLEEFIPATNKDIGSKALVAHISTVAINLTTAGATGTVFYFLELEVLAKEFAVDITNGWIMLVSILFALAAVMGIDFTLTSTGLAKGEADSAPFSGKMTHYAAGITAATAGIFRGLIYFQIVPAETEAEVIIKTIVLLAIAVLPVLVLYPAARISGYYMGWVYRENKRRMAEYKEIEHLWNLDFQEALKSHVASRVSTANTLQRKMANKPQELHPSRDEESHSAQAINLAGGISTYVKQAFESLCADGTGLDPLNIKPSDIVERLEAVGITGIKDGTLRLTIQRIKSSILNDILFEMDSSPFQNPEEFCERLSNKFGREVNPEEISAALLTDMQSKFGNR